MTSEVVLMNRQAVAMAADSAVTISGPQYLKTYQSVDKLFPLIEGQPVAVMIYHNAEIMSTPWETVISLYREAARGRSLDTVEAYAEDFMAFLSGNPDLFPADHQDTEFFKHVAVVYTVIAEDFDYQVAKFREQNSARLKEHLSAIFEFTVGELYADYQRYPDDSARADLACFPQGMSEQVRRRYRNEVEQLIERLQARGAHVYIPRKDLDYAITVGLRMLTLRRLVENRDGLYGARSGESAVLRYYANSIAHLV